MSSFCIANLLSPTPKASSVRASYNSQKTASTPKQTAKLSSPSDSASLMTAADLLHLTNASMLNPYNQPALTTVFGPNLNQPSAAAYPFAQLPPFFVNGFPSNGYFNPNSAIFQSNGMMLQQLNGRRKRRHRTIFSDEQLAILESNFSSNAYPDINLREKLAIQCDLKEERVEVWFKNRRAKERKKRHDFSVNESLVHGLTEGGAVSPFFEQSSSSEHKVSDESDCDEYVDRVTYPPRHTSATPSDIPKPLPDSVSRRPNCQSNRRKKRHLDSLTKAEESPTVKRTCTESRNLVESN